LAELADKPRVDTDHPPVSGEFGLRWTAEFEDSTVNWRDSLVVVVAVVDFDKLEVEQVAEKRWDKMTDLHTKVAAVWPGHRMEFVDIAVVVGVDKEEIDPGEVLVVVVVESAAVAGDYTRGS